MAKLLVTRPRLGSLWDIEARFEVLIDGNPNAPIGLGETIAIDLSPGAHQVSARIDGARSQPVLVDVALEQTHRLAVGPDVGFSRFRSWSLYLGMCPFVGLTVWHFIEMASRLQGVRGGTVSSHSNSYHALHMALLVPAALLMFMPLLAFLAYRRNHAFVFTEVPSPDLTVEQIAKLLRERPFHARITIRQLMIAVAISALCFWISLEVFRFTRTSQFQSVASMHAKLEDIFRGFNAAKADYHAEMRRKYAQAAASRSFSVDPDPSAPP